MDANILGLGAVLYQEQDGVEKVISYASQLLSKMESKYPIHNLEFLCLKWAITNQFHESLCGNSFDIYADNNCLTCVLSTSKLDMMGHKCIPGLANYNFHIHYKSGKSNVEADALSRIDWEKCDETIQADSIQIIVAAAITGDLANIESILYNVQAIESFLPIQSELAASSKGITNSSNKNHMTHLEQESSTLESITSVDDSDHLTTGPLENKLIPKCMTIQD